MSTIVLANKPGENPANFTTSLDEALVLGPNSRVSLVSANVDALNVLIVEDTGGQNEIQFRAKASDPLTVFTIPTGEYDPNSLANAIQNELNANAALYDGASGVSHIIRPYTFSPDTGGTGYKLSCTVTSRAQAAWTQPGALVNLTTNGTGGTTKAGADGWDAYSTADDHVSRGSFFVTSVVQTGRQAIMLLPAKPLVGVTVDPAYAVAQGGFAVEMVAFGSPYKVWDNLNPTGLDTVVNAAAGDQVRIIRAGGEINVVVQPTVGVSANAYLRPWLTTIQHRLVNAIYTAAGECRLVTLTNDIGDNQAPPLEHYAGPVEPESMLGAMVSSKRRYIFSREMATLLGYTTLTNDTPQQQYTVLNSDNPGNGTTQPPAIMVQIPSLNLSGRNGLTRATEPILAVLQTRELSTAGRLTYVAPYLAQIRTGFEIPTSVGRIDVMLKDLSGNIIEAIGRTVIVLTISD